MVKTDYNTTPRDCGGPQNSLNLWDEGAPAEVLADYGNAYQFMLYLKDRFGPNVLSRHPPRPRPAGPGRGRRPHFPRASTGSCTTSRP